MKTCARHTFATGMGTRGYTHVQAWSFAWHGEIEKARLTVGERANSFIRHRHSLISHGLLAAATSHMTKTGIANDDALTSTLARATCKEPPDCVRQLVLKRCLLQAAGAWHRPSNVPLPPSPQSRPGSRGPPSRDVGVSSISEGRCYAAEDRMRRHAHMAYLH